MWGLLNLKSQNQHIVFFPRLLFTTIYFEKKIEKVVFAIRCIFYIFLINILFLFWVYFKNNSNFLFHLRITFESEISWRQLPYKLPFIEFLLYRSLLYWFALTWKTVSIAMENELKFEGGVPSGKLNVPPNSCIPRSAKIKMKRKSKRSSDIIDFIELRSETTRFRNDDQYLQEKK